MDNNKNVVLQEVLDCIEKKINSCRIDIVAGSSIRDNAVIEKLKCFADAYLDIFCLVLSKFGKCDNND